MTKKHFTVGKLYALKTQLSLYKGIPLKTKIKTDIPNHRPFIVIISNQQGIEILMGNEKIWLSNESLDNISIYDFYEIREI